MRGPGVAPTTAQGGSPCDDAVSRGRPPRHRTARRIKGPLRAGMGEPLDASGCRRPPSPALPLEGGGGFTEPVYRLTLPDTGSGFSGGLAGFLGMSACDNGLR
jgi:hypothetical protein